MQKYKKALPLAILGFLLAPLLSLAQPSIVNPLKADNIVQLVGLILNFMLTLAYPVALFFLVWVGFKFVKAQGSESELTEAKKNLLYVLLGLAILLGAQLLSTVLQGTLGVVRS